MKNTKIVEKDPIKDKYNQKLGFFKKIQVKSVNFINSIKSNENLKEEVSYGVSMVLSVALYGLLGSFALSIFGIPLSLITFFGTGAILWLIENKFVGFIAQILSSIKLIEINN